jgi:hypothetical protein
LWPDQLRGVPWAALRSALFAPVRRGARSSCQREQIASVGDYRIVYTGLRLDQADLDVYEQVLHLGRNINLGEPVKFKTREMLRMLDRATGKQNREWLLKSLSRLAASEVEISNGKLTYAGSLIHEQGRDEEAGMHYIILNPRLGQLYAQGWHPVRWEERKALRGQQLAQWLHNFIAGQQRPLTFMVEDLIKLSDSNYARVRDFRKAFDEAAEAVQGIGIPLVLLWDLGRGAANGKVTITRKDWKS